MQPLTLDADRRTRGLWLAVGLAAVTIAVWYVCIQIFQPQPMVDERIHLYTIGRFHKGEWHLNKKLAMLPAYHALMSLVLKPFTPTLALARAVNAFVWIVAVCMYALILARQRRDCAAERLLHFAWQPILFAFTAMAYTESWTLLFVTIGLCLHIRKQFFWSAATMGCACLMRQSNLVWLGFLALAAIMQLRDELFPTLRWTEVVKSREFLTAAFQRTIGHGLVAAGAIAGLLKLKGVSVGTGSGQKVAGFNIGQFYMLAAVTLIAWAPIWTMRLPDAASALRRLLKQRPALCAAGLLAFAAMTTLLARTFSNPHIWNQLPKFFRNWLLVEMADNMVTRVLFIVLTLLIVALVARAVWTDPQRRMLTLVWLFSILHLLPIYRVEPRYAIVGMLFVNHWTTYSPTQSHLLAIWSGLVSVTACVAVARFQYFW